MFAETNGIHVKVCERSGDKLSRMVKSNPLMKGGCERLDCMVCVTGGKGDCRRSGAGYRITCLDCKEDDILATYEGETGRNPFTRGLEHKDDLKNKSESSPLWKHCTIQHGGRVAIFKMDALRPSKYPMVRQVNEGARIKVYKTDICMNSKSEFHQPSIVRTEAMRGNINEDQTGLRLGSQVLNRR